MQTAKVKIKDGTMCQLKFGALTEKVHFKVGGTSFSLIDPNKIQLPNIKEFETKTIEVKYQKSSLLYDGKRIYDFEENEFSSKPIVDLRHQSGKVIVSAGEVELEHDLTIESLPKKLFERRNNFKMVIHGVDNVNIIRFCDIHVHTENSTLDGMTKVKELAKKTEYACAITDHGNMFGYWDFYQQMKKNGKKPLIGFEGYIETINDSNLERDSKEYTNMYKNSEHILLLAKNETGLKNLFKLTSNAYGNFHRKPHITYEELEKYHDGVICTSACVGGTLGQAIINKDQKTAKMYLQKMIEIFGREDFYLELQNHSDPEETMVMDAIRKIAKQYSIKTVVGIDSHYLNKEDAEHHELWLCNQTKKKITDPTRMKFIGEGYWVHSSDEVLERFPNDLDAIDNTLEIADKCNVAIEFNGYHLPNFPLPEGFETQAEYFMFKCREGFKKRFKGTPMYTDPEYLERMKYETSIILKMGYPSYFLIVADFIQYAKDPNVKENLEQYLPKGYFNWDDIPEELIKDYVISIGPGRGSAAGSLASYCLGITDVDPIPYGLLFERFLAVERVSMPDIDVDIADDLRENLINYVRYKYGSDSVSRIITFGTAAAKAAVRLVCRVLDKPYATGDAIAKLIPERPKITLRDSFDESPEFKKAYEEDPEVKEIVDIAMKLEGLKTNISQHACGVLITPGPVTDYMPQILIEDEETGVKVPTTQLQMTECEDMGCLKMDFLGLRTLTMIQNALNLINNEIDKKNEGKPESEKISHIVESDIPIDDPKVYEFISTGNTDGVFQVESPYMKGLMKELYQDIGTNDQFDGTVGFSRLSDANALGRPGPMDEIPNYIKNMLHPEHVTYEVPAMENYLKPTYGVIVYQEQLMSLVKELAGFSAAQADIVRKGMAKKKEDILLEYGDYFVYGSVKNNIKGCVNNGIDEAIAKDLWDKMAKFGRYAFNKSHSVAYSVLSARTAWLASYYHVEFMAGVLNSFISKADKIKAYMSVCKRRHIKVYAPDVNLSDNQFTVSNNGIRFGLRGLKRMGAMSEVLLQERKERGHFKDIYDFVDRMSKHQKFGKAHYESLIYSGSLDSFGIKRYDLINAIPKFTESAKDVRDNAKCGQKTFGDFMSKEDIESVSRVVDFDITGNKIDKEIMLENEYAYTGFYITEHPIDAYSKILEEKNIPPIAMYSSDGEEDSSGWLKNKQSVKVAGIVKKLEKKYTRKNEPMATFELEDDSGYIECVMFPKVYDEFNSLIKENATVVISGKLKVDEFGNQIQVQKVFDIKNLTNDINIVALYVDLSSNVKVGRRQYVAMSNLIRECEPGDTRVYLQREGETYFINDASGNPISVALTLESLNKIYSVVGEQNCRALYGN